MQYTKLKLALLAATALGPHAAHCQSPFDGTWKIDAGRTTFTHSQETFLIKRERYRCDTCDPPLSVRADGTDHRVKNNAYFDTINVTILDDSTVEEEAKNHGKTVMTSKLVASRDGKTATLEWSEPGTRSGGPGAGGVTLTRIGMRKHSDVSHVLSGSWAVTGYVNPSDNTFTLRVEDDGKAISVTTAEGNVYRTPLSKVESPSVAKDGASASLGGTYSFTETLHRGGRAIREHRLMINPKIPAEMDIIDTDNLAGITVVLRAMRQ
jgi:hypothetical protein